MIVSINEQSQDIALGVDKSYEVKENLTENQDKSIIGAGDQGMMFGYATDEAKEYMPYAISLAHDLVSRLTQVRKENILDYLRPDGKAQVTVEYDENDMPIRLDAIVLSTQHDDKVTMDRLRQDIKKHVLDEVLPANLMDSETKIYINPTGRFVIGGPHGDSGLTGRKIIVDTYGGYARHGGGHFLERIVPRWTGLLPMQPVMWQKHSSRWVSKNVRFSFLMQLEWQNQLQ